MLTEDANSFIQCEGKGDSVAVANQQRPGSKQLMACVCAKLVSPAPLTSAAPPGQSEMDYPHAFWQDKHTNSVIRYLSLFSGKC